MHAVFEEREPLGQHVGVPHLVGNPDLVEQGPHLLVVATFHHEQQRAALVVQG